MKKAVIFDLDGTLLDTLGDLTAALNFALSAFGLPRKTVEQVRSYVGKGLKNLIIRAASSPDGSLLPGISEKEIDQIFERFARYYASHLDCYTRPYPGISQLVDRLYQQNVQIYVISNKQQSAADTLCNRFFGERIRFIMGETAETPRKPDPAMMDILLQKAGLQKEDCIYIGDSEVDVQFARNCAMSMVAVLWGFRTKEQLLTAGASVFAEDSDGLTDHFLKEGIIS